MRAAVLLILFGAMSVWAQPTYSRDVAPIIQQKCEVCHRAGDVAPFVLASYADLQPRLRSIEHAVTNRIMPPWKPVAGHGDFADSFALTDEERSTILRWIEIGAPEGDPADLPPPRAEAGEWQLGEPDAVIGMPAPYEVPLAKDTYRCFVLPTSFEEDRWVSAVQVVPGNRAVVHHVILFLDGSGQSETLDEKDPGPGYTCFGGPGLSLGPGRGALLDQIGGLGGWVPGMRTRHLPEGVGFLLPKQTRVVMQVHYHPHGHSEPDQTRFGLYFSKTKPSRRMLYVPVVNTTFKVQPHEVKTVRASLPVLPFFDAQLIQIVPHMHLLGREIKVEIERGSERQSLIYIDDWDFDWQGYYTYKTPVRIRSGSTVRLACTFDNRVDNPNNPNSPPIAVGWGEGSEDEMCLALLGVTFDNEAFILPLLGVLF